jgi:hypothetical protein
MLTVIGCLVEGVLRGAWESTRMPRDPRRSPAFAVETKQSFTSFINPFRGIAEIEQRLRPVHSM